RRRGGLTHARHELSETTLGDGQGSAGRLRGSGALSAADRDEWIDLRRAMRRHEACNHAGERNNERHDNEREYVMGADAIQECDTNRTLAESAAYPTSTPMVTIDIAWRITSDTMSRACAPRADRMPISQRV